MFFEAESLRSRGYQVRVLSTNDGEMRKNFEHKGIDTRYSLGLTHRLLGIFNLFRPPTSIDVQKLEPYRPRNWRKNVERHGFIQSIRSFDPAYIHFHQWPGIHLIEAARENTICPIIYSHHNILTQRCSADLIDEISKGIRCIDEIVFVSKAQKADFESKIPLDDVKTHFIPPVSALRIPAGHSDKESHREFQLGCLGSLKSIKNYELVIHATASLIEKGIHVRLNIAGDGPQRAYLENLYPNLVRERKIHFQGSINNDDDKRRFFENLHAFVISSKTEALPVVMIEALAFGLPIFSTKVGGIPEFLLEGKNGFFVDESNPLDLAKKIELFLEDSGLQEEISENNRELFADHFSDDAVGDQYDRVLSNSKLRSSRFLERNIGENLLEWPERSKRVAQIIISHAPREAFSLYDFGCGQQTIRKMLPPIARYIPLDRVLRTSDTILFDANTDPWNQSGDMALALGLLEYLDRPLDFLGSIQKFFPLVILSYNYQSNRQREIDNGWKNLLPKTEWETGLTGLGFEILEIEANTSYGIYVLKSGRSV